MQNTSNKHNEDIKKGNAGIAADFSWLTLRLASPERILEWSSGEVTKPETINYRTQRSEKNGLFDERIFGPERDFECYCGKYRGIRYKGITCEKCGVELTRAIVRRERMGHIDLATPVSHVWFLRSMPSRIALLLGMSSSDLEKVVYFAGYIVTRVVTEEKQRIVKELESEYKAKVKAVQDDKTKEALKERYLSAKKEIDTLHEGAVLDEMTYHAYSLKYGPMFEAGIGAEAIYEILKNFDLERLETELAKMLPEASAAEREKMGKRLSLTRSMNRAKLRPEWMFLSRIPVIPPALRPMVPLDGGRYATSDVNDLYRRVINRNNRLKKLIDINAPEVILRNEKRILQEAVDALIDSGVRHGSREQSVASAGRRSLRSLADNLKSKRGLFRQNLLGKRVDYSGRSVIVVGPELALHQCGLPKHMALELFRPFVISEILRKEFAFNIKGANRLIEEGTPEVWAILEEVIRGKYVLLNRAPTLHRLGIQAFQPILIEGSAIRVHPLVCHAFNADFDGDQMAVHLPLSVEAQTEAREIMSADKNILKPGSGDPTVSSKMLDIFLGVFWTTKIIAGKHGEKSVFADPQSAELTYNLGGVDLRAEIEVAVPENNPKFSAFQGIGRIKTTVGRILFNEVLPEEYAFINETVDNKKMKAIFDDIMSHSGMKAVTETLDRVKLFGFHYATKSGVTWGIDDVVIPEKKKEVISRSKAKSDEVTEQFRQGLLSADERFRKHIEIWHGAKNEIEKLIPESLDKNGSVYDMIFSGARGSFAQITQMVGMKGLIQNTAGETIEFPILSSSKEGLTPIEYFITTHGSRKGLTDTALNTAKAGYLTRKLFVVAQDVVVMEEDCGTKDAIVIEKGGVTGIESIAKAVRGRILADDITDASGNVLFKKKHLVTKEDATKIQSANITSVRVRSPLTCRSERGICVECYGMDLGKASKIALGEAVGTVAAQAIGEPGTQLTMRTFHAGGTASVGGDITQGLPRVEEIFEKRKPKNPAIVCMADGLVSEIKDEGREKIIVVTPNAMDKGSKEATEYRVAYHRMSLVKVGMEVKKGDVITDGSVDVDDLFDYSGREKAQNYIINEVSKPYELQGETVSRKHIEVIVRQMFSRFRVTDNGDTTLSIGEVVDTYELAEENRLAKEKGKTEAKASPLLMGITEVSLSRKSFLAAASFQHTTRVLIGSATRASTDHLHGLMENVIIGRIIPAGTGFPGSPKYNLIKEMNPPESDEDVS